MTVDQAPADAVAGRPLAEALAAPLLGAYRAGGFGLAFLLLGAMILTGAGFVDRGPVTYVLLGIGALLVLIPCYFFFVKEIRPIDRARKAVARNQELINQLQQAAVSAGQLGLMVQSVVYKHSRDVNAVLSPLRSQLRRIPFGLARQLADQPALVNAEALAAGVVSFSERAEEVLREINTAIIESDAARLRKYVDEADKLKASIRAVLAARSELAVEAAGGVEQDEPEAPVPA
ncbi:hypothetical protein [Catellatospora citrea]|uniref:5-bromo-4-chloroindolyl phosphate hydrolysis protein n=1 Tax=Catellatospora citrea TaxID=53366 RepID=A0A8J3NZU6_9ACTN|nr:hypothetical protein [Catellatospora citrea]RKE11244.1 hypothetical protein C8E86_6168 [Catellatospora citrea]GIF96710.1 hypothetical protein Cci01nite_18040 [Catellatospora citrea]